MHEGSQFPRFVIVGASWYGDWAKDFYLALKDLGVDAELFYTNTISGLDRGQITTLSVALERVKNTIKQKTPRLYDFLKKTKSGSSEKSLLDKFPHREGKLTYAVFIWTPPAKSTLIELKRRGVRPILWLGEPIMREKQWAETLAYFDYVFCVENRDSWMIHFDPAFRDKIILLPLASSPAKYFPLKSKTRDARLSPDIAFVGVYHPSRPKILSVLESYNFKIYGYGWERGFKEHPWIKEKYVGPVTAEEANIIFNSAKISVGTLGDLTPPGPTITQRTFDIALSQGFQISQDVPLIPKLFDGAIITFYDKDELKKQVDYYLAHSAERAKYAKKAHTIAVNGHTYKHRAETMLKRINYNA